MKTNALIGPVVSSLTRRRWLAGGVALAAAGSMRSSEGGEGWIDAHSHVWTPDLEAYPVAEGFSRDDLQPASFTGEELLAIARPHGVSRVVLIQMSFYRTDNRYMLDCIKGNPGVFSGVAIIDHEAADAVGEMRRLKAAGVRGFRLYASRENAGAWAASASMRRMWETAAEEGMAMCLLADPDALPAIRGMCRAHPSTKVVIDHFARLGMRGAATEEQVEQLTALAEFPLVNVKTSAFYALGQKRAPYLDLGPMIRQLRDAYGANRLMWASDCPYQAVGDHNYGDSIALIRDRLDFLSEEDRKWMLRGTAERLFF
jgi:predicted TIM-barrel fold metal-dependent hydrolase